MSNYLLVLHDCIFLLLAFFLGGARRAQYEATLVHVYAR